MTLPEFQKLWVGMLVVMLVIELPGAQQKCLFDEVQAQVRVVTIASSHPISPPNQRRLRPPDGEECPRTSRQQTSHRGRRSSMGGVALHAPASPQPIRIHTWIARESDNLSDAEKDRLMSAVEEAVRRVSSIVSGEPSHTHTHTQTHIYLCKERLICISY